MSRRHNPRTYELTREQDNWLRDFARMTFDARSSFSLDDRLADVLFAGIVCTFDIMNDREAS